MMNEIESWQRFPYPVSFYIRRLLWKSVWLTIWQLLPKRGPLKRGRALLLRLFGADIGEKCGFSASAYVEFPWQIKMKSHCTVGPRSVLYNLANVEFGTHVIISQDVYICAGTHDYTNLAYPLERKPIVIQDHVWVCAGAFIGPGVTVGEGSVVGARAVVTKNIEPWSVVAGNPAKFIKKRQLR